MNSHQKGNPGAETGTRVMKMWKPSRRTAMFTASAVLAVAAAFSGAQIAQADPTNPTNPTFNDLPCYANDSVYIPVDPTWDYLVIVGSRDQFVGVQGTNNLLNLESTRYPINISVWVYPAGNTSGDPVETSMLQFTNTGCTSPTSTTVVPTTTTKPPTTTTTVPTTTTSTSTSSPTKTENPSGQVCKGLDSGKIDVKDGVKSVTVTAPDGYLIAGYCVKAGSVNNGKGPVYVVLDEPVKTYTITYPGGKDISHYSVDYVKVPTSTNTTSTGTSSTTTSTPSTSTTTAGSQPTTSNGGNTPSPSTSRVNLGNAGTGMDGTARMVGHDATPPWGGLTAAFALGALLFGGFGLRSAYAKKH